MNLNPPITGNDELDSYLFNLKRTIDDILYLTEQNKAAIKNPGTISANNITNQGGWSIIPNNTNLDISFNGTKVATLDSSGKLITIDNVAAYTPI